MTKKNVSQRFCFDYRQFNALTVKDAYPLPRTLTTLLAPFPEQSASSSYIWLQGIQVPVDPASGGKAAFVPLHDCMSRSFSLCSSVITKHFERLMELILSGVRFKICLIYYDDVAVYGETFAEKLEHLGEVFARFKSAWLKLKKRGLNLANECYFRRASRTWATLSLHVISRLTLLRCRCDWSVPENVTEIKGHFPFDRNFRKFGNGGEWNENFPGKYPESPITVEFLNHSTESSKNFRE